MGKWTAYKSIKENFWTYFQDGGAETKQTLN